MTQNDHHSPSTAPEPGQPTGPASVTSLADRRRAREAALPQAQVTAQRARLRVATVEDTCWCCHAPVRAIAGAIADPALTPDGSGFLPLELVDELLVAELDPRELRSRKIGPLRHRESPGVAGGYIANGCIECDALIGRFRIEDLFHEHRMTGAPIGRLDSGIVLYADLQPAQRRLGRSTSL